MKRTLLVAFTAFTGAVCFGQFTQLNEPVIGDSRVLFVIDSLAPSFDAIVGAGAEWDYSGYAGYGDIQRAITVQDPSGTINAASFPSATKALAIQDFLIMYFTSTSDERTGYGFVFEEPSLGEIIAEFNADPAIQYIYPMALNDELTDNFAGTLSADLFGALTPDAEGTVNAKVDGQGTLKLANGVEFTDVLRYKLIESLIAELDVFGTIQEFEVIRTQYEYYDLTDGNLPVFVHTSIRIAQVGAAEPISEFSLVMSAEDPEAIVGISTMNVADFVVYPNPASDVLNVLLTQDQNNGAAHLIDAQGRIVMTETFSEGSVSFNVALLKSGVYVLQVMAGEHTSTKKVILN